MLTIAVDVTSGEVRNAVSVSAVPRSRNGLSAQLLSSSPVMVARGDPLDFTNSVSLLLPTNLSRSSKDDLVEVLTRRQVASCANALSNR